MASDPPGHRVAISKAAIADLAELAGVALEAKAYWGYPEEWLEAWRDELQASPAQVESGWVFAARQRETIVGWCALEEDPPDGEIIACWVRPSYMRAGIGGRLLDRILEEARRAGIATVSTLADPNAEGFYLDRGFEFVGWEASFPPGRRLPRLRRDLTRR